MGIEFNTGRGRYRLGAAGALEKLPDAVSITLVLERSDGIEKVAFKCTVSSNLLDREVEAVDAVWLTDQLALWIEREFEMTRELALKSIRTERSLMTLTFDESNRGPF